MFLRPHFHIKNFMLGEDMYVADFGSGTGIYSTLAADIVGKRGKIYAIDLQPELLKAAHAEAKSHGHTHVHILHGDIEKAGGSGLRDASVDRVLLSNVLHQTIQRSKVLEEAHRVLKPKGIAVIVDWTANNLSIGPIPEYAFSKDSAIELAAAVGFNYEKEIDAGDYHYGLILRKP